MGMTMTQKILAAHAGLPEVSAGQLIEAKLDLVLGNDITSPVAIHEMEKMNTKTVFDKDKIALVPDHFVSHGKQSCYRSSYCNNRNTGQYKSQIQRKKIAKPFQCFDDRISGIRSLFHPIHWIIFADQFFFHFHLRSNFRDRTPFFCFLHFIILQNIAHFYIPFRIICTIQFLFYHFSPQKTIK